MTTNQQWFDAIQAMAVTGVARTYAQRPDSLTTADCPAAWPMLPSVDQGQLISSCTDLSKQRQCDYIIAYNPINQDTGEANLENIVPFIDNLETALEALTVMNFIEYQIETTAEIVVAGVPFYGLRATIIGRNAY